MGNTDEWLHLGLDDQQIEQRRKEHGTNELTPPKRPSMWRLYLEKFQDPVIRILLVAAFFSLIVAFVEKEFAETIGILIAILLATGIGFYFEYDAARKFDVLNALGGETKVRVVRNGCVCEVSRKDLVVGDVIFLDTGDEIPADAELLQAESLQVNESNLTGEPVAQKTTVEADFDENAPYPGNHLLRGTTIVEGSAIAKVIAVGDNTEIGKVAREATALTGEKTPLDKQLERLAKMISIVGYTVAALAFSFFTIHGLQHYIPSVEQWTSAEYIHVCKIVLDNFMMAVTLIVMAVPEGLPMAVTLSLALNMRRMLKTNNLVRKMHACETMGAITVICTDKTGTLTQNRMTVSEMLMSEKDRELLCESIAVNTTAFLNDERTEGLGNPTEVALLLWMQAAGKDYLTIRNAVKQLARLPFASERKYMATLVESPLSSKKLLYVKGAPEIVLGLCGGLTEVQVQEYHSQLQKWQAHAQRTLLMVYKEIDEVSDDLAIEVDKGGFTLLGLAAISDPVREEVPGAVESSLNAGVKIKVVTGDSTGTAVEIARQIGLWSADDTDRNCMKGVEFAALSDEEALARIDDLKVMSRARPLDKQRLVRLLQSKGEVVAVTGDGTNDAPALNFAQVGLSMGTGTSVAKEASDITLLDDSFRSIVTAIMWGRSLYKNIQRFVMFQLTINFTALMIVLVGAFMDTALPLTVTQMLWVNIIMDTFAALALASLSADPKVMNEPPRPIKQFIITRPIWYSILGYGTAFVTCLLLITMYVRHTTGTMNIHQLTLFLTFFVLLQFWNLLNAKTYGSSDSAFHHLKKDKGVLLVLGLILAGQWLIVEWGGNMFRTEPLSWCEWGLLLALSSIVLWVGEVVRLVMRWKERSR